MTATMEETAARFFASVLSDEEWKAIPSEIAKKIENLTEGKFEELITSKALSETAKFNAEKTLTELKNELETVKNENEQFKNKLEAATSTITELESQLSNTVSETTKLRETCNRLEKEVSDYRHQRNLAVDERDEFSKMLERRNAEIERTQSDLLAVTKQLEVAVAAKCEALAKSEEVAALKMTLEYKEKRIEQERNLLNQQMETLTEELRNKTDELLNMRRDNTTRCFQLETKLTEKLQELKLATDTVKTLTDTNNNLLVKIEEFNKKLAEEKDVAVKTQEAFQHEMDAQKKLASLYKDMSEEKTDLAEKLTEGFQEVKGKLDEAVEKYGELETKYKETCLSHEEILSKKNECITMLKKELEAAQDLIENVKSESFQKEVEGLSPSAAITSKFIKSGMTMTQIYSEYTSAVEQLTTSREEVSRLQLYLNSIVQEIEDKSPYLVKQREDYEKALETIAELTKQNDDLINDMQALRDSTSEAKRSEGVVSRENSRLKKELQDLGRQVCHLLREVEQSRAGSSSTSTDQDLSDSTSSADIITKRLVTFSDISELQANNQRLLALVRELSSKHEEVEELDLAEVAKLKAKVENMREQHADLLEQQERQAKMMNMLINQRDMYKSLYSQAVKGTGEDMINLENSSRENSAESPKRDFENQGEEKTHEFEVKIENLQKEIKTIKEEYEIYKKEKTANEKILLEQMEKCRSDLNDMVCQNAKLTTKIETSDEMFKVLKSNTAIYKNQIEKLEERNKIYTETIAKHETSSKYLRDEAIDAQTKLARAEVLVSNFQKENLLLRDSEARLLKERESLKREAHAQNLMQTNIELIKATLERSDAESKMRLEQQLQEAHRECAALRRRLQEEQDRFRQLTEHLEKQTQTAQSRMEEEKEHAEKLRNELVSMREDLTAKSMQVEDLSKKLKTSLFSGADSSGDSKKYRELEKMLNERQVEIESLQEKLKAAKGAIEQHCNVAECAEKQLVDIAEQNKKYKEAAENKIKEQDQRIKQLEEQCSELQGELSVYNDGQESAILERAQIQTAKELADAKRELDATRNEIKVLQQNLESAENKYVHEMMLHSNDLKTLTTVKEELTSAVSEIEAAKSARDKANIALEESKQCWSKQEELFTREKEELEKRFKDLDAQNSLLLNQLQELNAQLSIVQAHTSDSNTSLGDVSLNKSLTEDDVKSSEQLLKIIKYLRQEKDIAVSKCEILEAEHVRLKSQFDVIGKQLEEAKSALETERQTSDVSFVTAAKHAEVLRKVETLNAITDSNRSLRIERDSLLGQVNELRARTASLEEQLAPLQEKNRELSIKAESMQTENLTLRGEATRWRQRANMLIEKSNRTSPEDWKKLQNERESLAKQLMVERSNNTQLNAEVNNLTKEKAKLDEQLKEIRRQVAQQKDDLDRLNEEVSSLRNQVTTLNSDLTQNRTDHGKLTEEHKALTEDAITKEAMITDLKNNLVQIRKIAKKYKTQCEEQSKELESLKQQLQDSKESEIPADKQEQFRQEGRSEVEERLNELEQTHQLKLDEVNQQVTTVNEENETYKKEIENLKQTSLEKEERFKTLFKNAKDRIMTLTEQNTSLKAELNNQERQGKGTSDIDKEKAEEIDRLKREKEDIQVEKQAEKERLTQEIETLTQRVNQLQRQLGLQQGSKPSTSSGPTEKSTTEPPTANIKPMSGHSTTQTQSVTIQPWRSGVEPPLASIRPMSMQLRTVAALRTGQSPSVMVPPQQVHTTGTSNIEALSSSPTSSHTDYAPATSSASSAMLGPRQVAVPPTQSSQDAEDEENSMQVQTAPQQQAVALVLPRVEPPNSASGPTQEQGTSSSSSSNTVTTTQAGHKRPREADADGCQSDENSKQQQQPKRTRVQGAPETFQSVSESGLEVEYQVPTSSQRDHEEDTEAVIVVESDEEGDGPDEGEGADDDPDDPDTEGYDMEATYVEQMNFEDAECQDVEEDEAGNEVEVIEDSSEVPNQSERQEVGTQEESAEQAQSEATSSGTDGGASCGVTVSQASTSVSVTMPSSRTRPVAPLSRQQQTHLLLPEEGGDDGIVPSTPTLFVPRRSDGFGEAVSSPNVPTSGRFTFNESGSQNNTSNEVIPEQTLEANLDDDSTGRSVPSTPLQASPQEAGPSGEEQSSHQTLHTDGEIPSITVSGVGDETEQAPEGSTGDMGPPSVAGTSTETQSSEQAEEMLEGDDGVSSEGEKSITTKEGGGEEEGREAEASPSTNTRSKAGTTRGSGGSSRRSLRQSHMRGGESRPGPTPIVWADQRDNRHGESVLPIHGQHSHSESRFWSTENRSTTYNVHAQNHSKGQRGRGQGSYSPRVARRSRGRMQRPYGGGGNRF